MNQGKLGLVKQAMSRVSINILGIGELKRMGMGEFNSDDHYIYYCGQEWNSPHNLMLKLKLQYFGHLMLTHWKRP